MCLTQNPCQNGGFCSINSAGQVTCQCKNGYSGIYCDGNYENKVVETFIRKNFVNFKLEVLATTLFVKMEALVWIELEISIANAPRIITERFVIFM